MSPMARTMETAGVLLVLMALAATATAQNAKNPHGSYLGCFDLDRMEGVTDKGAPARFNAKNLFKCSAFCRDKGHALNAISTDLACHCVSLIPSEDARVAESECADETGNGVALFYNHLNAGINSCRLANVKMAKSSFNFHYNDYHAEFSPDGVMSIKMEGSNGLRFTTNDGMHLYGMFQVTGKVCNASGAVTAFYTRSSDEYNTANHGDFSEIDFEFLNGDPGVPAGLWLNTFHKGMSGGERLVKPEEYRKKLGLKEGEDASNTFLTYSFNWQPDQVAWYTNGDLLLRRRYDDTVKWKDMKGVAFERIYRPPNSPQHVTFSMWSDQDQERAFGGKLAWDQSPFVSQFRDLRRVLCDNPRAASNGPAWAYPAKKEKEDGSKDNAYNGPPGDALRNARAEDAKAGSAKS